MCAIGVHFQLLMWHDTACISDHRYCLSSRMHFACELSGRKRKSVPSVYAKALMQGSCLLASDVFYQGMLVPILCLIATCGARRRDDPLLAVSAAVPAASRESGRHLSFPSGQDNLVCICTRLWPRVFWPNVWRHSWS